jgi:hypothetical protein
MRENKHLLAHGKYLQPIVVRVLFFFASDISGYIKYQFLCGNRNYVP